jgi:hypothetical protein
MTGETIARGLRLRRAGKGRWNGQCPACGYKAGFAVTERRGELPLLYCHAGRCGQAELIEALGKLGLWPNHTERDTKKTPRRTRSSVKMPSPAELPAAVIERREIALAIWRRTLPAMARLGPATVVQQYLRQRGYLCEVPPVLRHLPDAKHPNGRAPAMVALVEHVDHGPVAVHRTFLRWDGTGKAGLDPNKMTLGPCRGGAVRLALAGPILGVAEGIETALSYMQTTGIPTWAALSTSGIRTLILPPEVQEIIIAADADIPGIRAAQAAARRWLNEGRQVRISRPPVGQDFNDLLVAS